MSVSEPHNRSNLRMTREQSFAQLSEVVSVIGKGPVAINVSLSTVFGCPMQGDVPVREVLHWVERFADLGARGVTLCDTTGMAYPSQVEALSRAVHERFPPLQLTLHFHNTRGMALRWRPSGRVDRSTHPLAAWAFALCARGHGSVYRRLRFYAVLMGFSTG
jgi:hydroxymethylglutaryl-CoA lyase